MLLSWAQIGSPSLHDMPLIVLPLLDRDGE